MKWLHISAKYNISILYYFTGGPAQNDKDSQLHIWVLA